jgi:hypothetical protein
MARPQLGGETRTSACAGGARNRMNPNSGKPAGRRWFESDFQRFKQRSRATFGAKQNSVFGTARTLLGTIQLRRIHIGDAATVLSYGLDEILDGVSIFNVFGGPRGDRTHDHLIKSQMLYH